jgi:hypothetical protein
LHSVSPDAPLEKEHTYIAKYLRASLTVTSTDLVWVACRVTGREGETAER